MPPALPRRVTELMLDDAERVVAARIHRALVLRYAPASYLAVDGCEELTIGLIGDARLRRALLRDGERARARSLRRLRQLGQDRLDRAWRSPSQAGRPAASPLTRDYPTSDKPPPLPQSGNAAPRSSDVGYAAACAAPDRR